MGSGINLLDRRCNSGMSCKQVVGIMSSNRTEGEKKRILNELRENLLLALHYARGENVNLIRTRRHVRQSLDKLSEIEETLT